MNPCATATPQTDIEGDGRWNSIVSKILHLGKHYYLYQKLIIIYVNQ